MKYTIEGFSQKRMVEFGMDCVDAVFLRWFLDFVSTGQMRSVIVEGKTYYWLMYRYVIEELPLMRISSSESLGERLRRLCGNPKVRKGRTAVVRQPVLEHHLVKNAAGTYSYFRMIPGVMASLISDTEATRAKPQAGSGQTPDGDRAKTRNKDSSSSDSSSRINQERSDRGNTAHRLPSSIDPEEEAKKETSKAERDSQLRASSLQALESSAPPAAESRRSDGAARQFQRECEKCGEIILLVEEGVEHWRAENSYDESPHRCRLGKQAAA